METLRASMVFWVDKDNDLSVFPQKRLRVKEIQNGQGKSSTYYVAHEIELPLHELKFHFLKLKNLKRSRCTSLKLFFKNLPDEEELKHRGFTITKEGWSHSHLDIQAYIVPCGKEWCMALENHKTSIGVPVRALELIPYTYAQETLFNGFMEVV